MASDSGLDCPATITYALPTTCQPTQQQISSIFDSAPTVSDHSSLYPPPARLLAILLPPPLYVGYLFAASATLHKKNVHRLFTPCTLLLRL